MNRIREVLARLSGKSKDDASIRRTNTIAKGESSSSREDLGRGPIVLYNGVPEGEEGVDIIFVHGLHGHRITSWTKGQGQICWPRDLLGHDVQKARIVSWGWATNSAGFTDQAETLLMDVSRMRNGVNRPIIFVGHGLGGVVIKEALATAAMSRIYGSYTQLGNVYPSTIGCVFLGTPHSRSGKRSLGDCVATTALLAPRMPTAQMLRELRESSEAFGRLHSTFLMVSRDIKVVCVREELPTAVKDPDSKGMVQVMVPRDSAYTGFNVTKDEIRVNHADLARFASREDLGYLQLVAHISRISSGPSAAEVEARSVRNQQILDALYFDTMTERESRIDQAYGQTCEWIMSPDISPFHAFLSSHDPILWISGKAGSGKSTLIKHVWHSKLMREELAEGWAKDGDLHLACFFMFEGGNRIQKGYEGFLRSVMYQILSARQDLIRVAFPSFSDPESPWPPPVLFTSVNNLNAGFYSIFAHMAEKLRLFVFIDGIDEYRIMERKDHYEPKDLDVSYSGGGDMSWGASKWIHDSHTEIANLVNTMANKDIVKFVVTSRELPVFEQAFNEHPRMRLQEFTEPAITQYIGGRLDREAPGLPDMQSLCQHVAKKSHGDVLWARLAIDMVVDCSLRTLRPMLDSLPEHLGGPDGLYMCMLERLTPGQQRDGYRAFQLVARAQQPPSLVTLALADEGHWDAEGNLRSTNDNQNPHTVTSIQRLSTNELRRLETCCAGLLVAEAGPRTPPPIKGENRMSQKRVVFSHQTSKEWVVRKDIWKKLPGVTPVDQVDLDFSLLSGCVRHIKAFHLYSSPVWVWPKPKFVSDAWLLIANALRYAERIDGELGGREAEKYVELLDDLDDTCQRTWVSALQSQKPMNEFPGTHEKRLGKHWAGFEPMEAGKSPKRRDFLALAVQANLMRYTAAKLRQIGDVEGRRWKAQELLAYVVCPSCQGFSSCVSLSGDYLDFHHDMPDTRLLDVLFDAGADARDNGLWTTALKTGQRYFSRGSATMTHLMETGASRRLILNRERWVAAVKAMLLHGADPMAEVTVFTGSGEESKSTTTVAAVDLIRETLDGEPEFALEMQELEGLMGGRRNSMTLPPYTRHAE